MHILDHEAIFVEVDEITIETVGTPAPPETFFDLKELAIEIVCQELFIFFEVDEMTTEAVFTPAPPETFFDVKEIGIEICTVPA